MAVARPADNRIVIADGQPRVAKVIDRATAMDKAEMYVVRNLPKYLKHLHMLALGKLWAVKNTKEGPQVYAIPPDRAALEYLIERGLGKVPQRHEITGQDGGAIEIIPWAPVGMIIEGESKDVTGEPTELSPADFALSEQAEE